MLQLEHILKILLNDVLLYGSYFSRREKKLLVEQKTIFALKITVKS